MEDSGTGGRAIMLMVDETDYFVIREFSSRPKRVVREETRPVKKNQDPEISRSFGKRTMVKDESR